jgi:DNA repair protein RadA/Sms
VAGAILSAREDVAIPPDMVLFGEISLSGALRPVGQTENRLKEASKLGFTQAVAPRLSKYTQASGITLREMPDLTAFVGEMFGAG